MSTQQCPGQDMRQWTFDDVFEEPCPFCGALVEFFKTDIRTPCPACRRQVANPRKDPGCAKWCPAAEQCLGSVDDEGRQEDQNS